MIVCVVSGESCAEARSGSAECSGLQVSLESEWADRHARRSITELNSDSHSPSSTGIAHSPLRGETSPSCGVFPTLKISRRRLRRAACLPAALRLGSTLITSVCPCQVGSRAYFSLRATTVLTDVHASSQASSYPVADPDFDPESLSASPVAWRRSHNTAAARVTPAAHRAGVCSRRASPNSSASAVSALTVPRFARICASHAFLGLPRRQCLCLRR